MPDDHDHLFDPVRREVACVCSACALPGTATADRPWKRIPREVLRLPDMHISEQAWRSMGMQVRLAFLWHSSDRDEVVGAYPSPAGATEAAVPREAWRKLVAEHPALGHLKPDVEALLVNRLGASERYYLVPIDQCFRLVGIVREGGGGLGGAAASDRIARFFEWLDARGRVAHA